jgi:alpha-N-arabinofuranosidase
LVKIACIAQIVNIIAPLLTKRDDLLVQSTYYPFAIMAEHARGKSLVPILDCPTYAAGERGETPALDVSATLAEDGTLAAFAVNRSQTEDAVLHVSLADARVQSVQSVRLLTGPDPKAVNSWEKPDVVKPTVGTARVLDDGAVEVNVPRLGFAAVTARVAAR